MNTDQKTIDRQIEEIINGIHKMSEAYVVGSDYAVADWETSLNIACDELKESIAIEKQKAREEGIKEFIEWYDPTSDNLMVAVDEFLAQPKEEKERHEGTQK